MCFLNYFRIQKAVKNLNKQKAILGKPSHPNQAWKPLTLSYLRSYLGEQDDIYLSIQNFKLHNPPENWKQGDFTWPDVLKKIMLQKLDAAIERIENGEIIPQKHNFFCKIPIPAATAILITLLVTIPAIFFNYGKESGRIEYKDELDKQSGLINKFSRKNDSLFNVVLFLRDSLANRPPQPKDER